MRATTYLIGIPVVVVTAVIAVANRQPVTFSLNPFSSSGAAAALSVRMPLFALLLAALALGVIVGGLAAVLSRRRREKARARQAAARAEVAGLPARMDGSKPHGS